MKNITNFFQITDSIATSGQPSKEQFALIKQAGYHSVINLAMPDSDHSIPDEGQLVTLQGMNYFHLPVPFDAPTKNHLTIFAQLVSSLEKSEHNKIWIHCVVNARVSAFMFQYLTQIKHCSTEESESPILKKWKLNMDDTWKDFLSIKLEL